VSVFLVHLRREWREHRLAVLVLAGLVVGLVAASRLVLDREVLGDRLFVDVVTAAAALGALFAIGGEVLAGERARDGLAFLGRLPAGLERSFRAKGVFFVVLVAAFAALGALAARIAGVSAEVQHAGAYEQVAILTLLGFAILAAWTFAVSAWVPRGSLATPLAGLLLVALAWPAWWMLSGSFDYVPRRDEVVAALALLVVGAALAARAGFVGGRRADARALRSALRGGTVLLGTCVPLWTWAGWRLHEHANLDPTGRGEEASLLGVWSAESGVLAEVTVRPRRWKSWTTFLLRRAEGEGAWSALGEARDGGVVEGRVGAPGAEARRALALATPGFASVAAFDLASGAPVDAEAFAPDRPETSAGLGFQTRRDGRDGIFDPLRDRFFAIRDLEGALEGASEYDLYVAPGAWLLVTLDHLYERFDPETGTRTPLPWPVRKGWDEPPMLADGRVVLLDGLAPLLGDPASGELVRLAIDGVQGAQVDAFLRPPWGGEDVLRATGCMLLEDASRWYRLDVATDQLLTLHDSPWTWEVAPSPRRDEVLAIEGAARLLRLDVATGDIEVLLEVGS